MPLAKRGLFPPADLEAKDAPLPTAFAIVEPPAASKAAWYPDDYTPVWNTMEVDDHLDHVGHARTLLSQIYYRQNMYVHSAQWCDSNDVNMFMTPIIVMGGLASFCGFAATSPLVETRNEIRTGISLLGGVLGALVTVITTLRTQNKYDIKAEMFRGAAGQYRLLATRLEERMRTHRMAMVDPSWKDKEARQKEIETFNNFFLEQYRTVQTAQSEMKYFPPNKAVAQWKKAKKLLPNEVDQPEIDRHTQASLLDSFEPEEP
mmetsp:Transcript_89023/g.172459  ORF Transcript_89023/g.172459 Transcript_89023/m.172459 type:complete len:261 (-) Transcript_89023:147-929(-)